MKRFVIVLVALSALGLGSCTLKSHKIKSMEKGDDNMKSWVEIIYSNEEG